MILFYTFKVHEIEFFRGKYVPDPAGGVHCGEVRRVNEE